ncbi:hypothetical protein TNCV_43971 [Trichonephila clavipes]|nr:hypothetical protein TNCV_43971 [Trichonephila clavipes]
MSGQICSCLEFAHGIRLEFLYESPLTGCGEIPFGGMRQKSSRVKKFTKVHLILRWCNTATASGPIREIILDKTKSPALGVLGDKVLNKNGTHPILETKSRSQSYRGTVLRDSGRRPCPSPSTLPL